MIPLLWPLAFLGICNIYICDRLNLAYFYKKPPISDTQLQNSLLLVMKLFPVLTFVCGYWAMGNRQIFHNVINQKTLSNEPLDTGHNKYMPQDVDHTIMLALFFV